MAKTLKKILEVYAPRSKDEKRFRDKHVVVRSKLDDKGTQDDKMFNATNIKAVDRSTEGHGYNPGEDEKVYEELHRLALHVKPVKVNGKTKYKVHAVGKELEGIEAGEHLSDTELDDAAEMGAKIKHLKEDSLDEKTLTPAEMKKREEVAKAIARENPKMPMAKKMAIATATAKKVAEDVEEKEEVYLDEGEQGDLRRVSNRVMNKIGKKYGVNTQKTKYKAAAQNDAANTPSHMRKDITSSLRKMKEEAEYINESEGSHKVFQDQHNEAAKTLKAITKTLSDHYDNVTSKKNYNKGEAQWHHVSTIKNINRALQDIHHEVAREVDYSKPPELAKLKEEVEEDNNLSVLLSAIYENLSDENKQVFEDIMENDPDKMIDFLDQLEISYDE